MHSRTERNQEDDEGKTNQTISLYMNREMCLARGVYKPAREGQTAGVRQLLGNDVVVCQR